MALSFGDKEGHLALVAHYCGERKTTNMSDQLGNFGFSQFYSIDTIFFTLR